MSTFKLQTKPLPKFSPDKSPQVYRFKNEKLRCIVQEVEDPMNAACILFKEKKKRKETKLNSARDHRQAQKTWFPQMRNAMLASSEFPVSPYPTPFLCGRGEFGCLCLDPLCRRYLPISEPHVLGFGSLGLGNVTVALDHEAIDMIDGLKDSVDKFQHSLDKISATVTIKEDISNSIASASESLSDFATVLLIIAVVWMIKPQTNNEKILVCVMVVSFMATRSTLRDFVTNSSLFSWLQSPKAEPQGLDFGPDQDGLASMLVTLINSYLCLQQGREIFKPRVFVRTMSELNRVGSTVGGMIRGLSLMVSYVSSSIDSWYNGTPFFLKSGHQFIDVFLEEATAIIDSFENKTLHNLQTSVDRVRAAIDHGTSMQMKIPGGPQYAGIRTCILNHLQELTKIRKALMASNFKFNGIRQEPATIFLRGAPGTMKSQAMQHLAHAAIALTASADEFGLYVEQPGSKVFNRQAENVYWDGYTAQHDVTMFDDVLQARDIAGSPDNEAMNVIRSVNIFEYQLHCAAMEKKGNTNFRSKFVLLNSNMMNDLHLESIHDVGAFARRMDLVYDVCPKAEYSVDPNVSPTDRKFDVSKFPRWKAEEVGADVDLIGTTRTHPNMCDYHLKKLQGKGKFVDAGVVHSFDQIISEYMKVYEMKRAQYTSYLKTLDETLHGARAKFEKENDIFMEDVKETWQPQSAPASNRMYVEEETYNLETDEESLSMAEPTSSEITEVNSALTYSNIRPSPAAMNEIILTRLNAVALLNPTARQLIEEVYLSMVYYVVQRCPQIDHVIFFAIFQNRVEEFSLFLGVPYQGNDWIQREVPSQLFEPLNLLTLRCLMIRMCSTTSVPMANPQMGEPKGKEPEKPSIRDRMESMIIEGLEEDRMVELMSLKGISFDKYQAFITFMIEALARSEDETGVIMLVDDAYDSVKRVVEWKHVLFHQDYSINKKAYDPKSSFIRDFLSTPRESTSSFREILLEKANKEFAELKTKASDPLLDKIWRIYVACKSFLCEEEGDSQDVVQAKFFKKIGVGMLAGAGLRALVNIVSPLLESLWPQSDERRSRNPPRSRVGRVVKSRPQNNGGKQTIEIAPQSVARTNENLRSIMRMVSNRSTFIVYFPLPKDERKPGSTHSIAGFATGIRGRVLLMPYHFVSAVNSMELDGSIDATDLISLKRPKTEDHFLLLTVKEFLDGFRHWDAGEKQDIALVRMPIRFQPIRDILSHVATQKQLENYKKVDAVLHIPSDDLGEVHSVFAIFGRNFPVGLDYYDPYEVKEAFEYSAHTSPGDCGSQLWVNDRSNPALLIGIHVAGITPKKFGFSARISREFLKEGLEFMGEEDSFVEPLPELVSTDFPVPPQMYGMGEAAPGVRVPNRISRTKLKPSVIKDQVFVSDKAPARLRPFVLDGETVDPARIALNQYCTSDVFIEPQNLKYATESLRDYLFSNITDQNSVEGARIFTFEEAVLGDGPGSEFTSINRGTSAGYPYTCLPGKSSKERFFGSGPEFDFSNSECQLLRERCSLIIDNAKHKKRMNHVFTDSLKDERRSLKKVALGKTRMFSGCPTPLLIVSRMYFGSFQKFIIRNRITNGIAIGVNEYSSEWDLIARRLNQFGDGLNKGAGDFHGFDMREKVAVMDKIRWIIEDYYDTVGEATSEDRRVRAVLFEEITNSLHVHEGVFMYWVSSLPSGHPLTIIINCLYNCMLFRMCWFDIIPHSMARYHFNDYVYLIVTGDDNVYSVREEFKHLFNERAVQQAMIRYGQDYTPEDKEVTEFGTGMRSLCQVSFLKRTFRLYRGIYIAPLDLNTILDIPNWTKEGANYIADAEANVRVALEELSLHPREVFEYWCPKFVRACLNTPGMNAPEYTSYDVLHKMVMSRDGPSATLIDRLLFDYGDTSGTIAEPQVGVERLEEVQAYVANTFTSRMACWQPQLYPGSRKTHERLIHRHVLKRIATTLNTQQQENRMSVTRDSEIDADNQGSSTVRIVADGEVVVAEPSYYKELSREVLSAMPTGSEQSVQDFFKRPVVVFSSSFSITDTTTTWPWQARIPHDLIASGPWKPKLLGSAGFRGELHLTIVVNANRFQQGRYILAWCPNGGSTDVNRLFVRTHTATITQMTQLPHVEIDISCDTEATLIIPHVNVQGWSYIGAADVTGAYLGTTGEVLLRAYSPLVAPTGSTTAGYTILAHWENVEFATPINPQSNVRSRTKIKRKVRAVDVEQDSQNMGPVQSTLTKVSVAMGKLAGIPLLASVAAPAHWAVELASQVAGAFGWSRPHNSEHARIMTAYAAHRMTNVDVADNSTKLGYTDKNELEEVPGFAGSALDEMALEYVMKISAYIDQFTWNTSQVAGQKIHSRFCNPRGQITTQNAGGATVTHMAPVAFVASFFALYRGSLKFTFKIVKTEFHSGRLQISFLPTDTAYGASNQPTQGSFSDGNYLAREIIDIRTGSEFTIIPPFSAIQQYKSMGGGGGSYATLLIHVLDPLVAPSSVSSEVQVLVEVSAADDLEFAQPYAPLWTPAVQVQPQMGKNTCEIVSSVVGGQTIMNDGAAARACIGERIVSFRQILKRFSLFKNVGTSYAQNANLYSFVPFMNTVSMIGSIYGITHSAQPADLIGKVSACYAMQRGGVRIKFVTADAVNPKAFITSHASGEGDVSRDVGSWFTLNDTGSWRANRSLAFFDFSLTGCAEVEFPFYNRFHSSAVGDLWSSDAVTVPQVSYKHGSTVPMTTGRYSVSVAPTPDVYMFRAASDDFSLGLFVSVPPVLNWAGTE